MVVETCDPSTSPHLFRFLQITVSVELLWSILTHSVPLFPSKVTAKTINRSYLTSTSFYFDRLSPLHILIYISGETDGWYISRSHFYGVSFNTMLQFSPLHPSNLSRNGISNAWYSSETSFSHWYDVFFEREEGFASYPVKLFIFTEKGYDGGERWKDSPKSDNNLFSVSLIDRFPVFVGIQLLLHIS